MTHAWSLLAFAILFAVIVWEFWRRKQLTQKSNHPADLGDDGVTCAWSREYVAGSETVVIRHEDGRPRVLTKV